MNLVDGLLNQLNADLDARTSDALNQIGGEFVSLLLDEVPVHQGILKSTIHLEPAVREGAAIVARVVIGDDHATPYLGDLINGLDASDEVYHYGHPYMHFTDWENGPEDLRGPDGFFHFRSVRHLVHRNDFINRAFSRVSFARLEQLFAQAVF